MHYFRTGGKKPRRGEAVCEANERCYFDNGLGASTVSPINIVCVCTHSCMRCERQVRECEGPFAPYAQACPLICSAVVQLPPFFLRTGEARRPDHYTLNRRRDYCFASAIKWHWLTLGLLRQ